MVYTSRCGWWWCWCWCVYPQRPKVIPCLLWWFLFLAKRAIKSGFYYFTELWTRNINDRKKCLFYPWWCVNLILDLVFFSNKIELDLWLLWWWWYGFFFVFRQTTTSVMICNVFSYHLFLFCICVCVCVWFDLVIYAIAIIKYCIIFLIRFSSTNDDDFVELLFCFFFGILSQKKLRCIDWLFWL